MGAVTRLVAVAFVAAAVFSAACRSHNGPSDEIAGSWRGTIADTVAGSGTINVTLKRTGPALSGTWSAKFNASGDTRTGALSGTIVGSTVSLIFVYEPPMVCVGGEKIGSTMAFNGTFGAAGWSGSYVTLVCSGVRTGTIDVMRE